MTMQVHAGTSGFSYKEWRGAFYPEKLPADEMLSYYADRFDTVEINNTFYRMPSTKQLGAWAAQVPPGFTFALKASRQITHSKRLKEAHEAVAYLFQQLAALDERLGPVLFQLPPNLKKDLPRLEAFLAGLPAARRVAFEFRNPSWFEEDVLAALRTHGAALCIAHGEELDTPFEPTADWGYLRLRQVAYDDAALGAWAERVRTQRWSEVFAFFKHEDEATGPRLAARFLELVSAAPTV
jgi:uncharacterized protein YecE (DUF72 family)